MLAYLAYWFVIDFYGLPAAFICTAIPLPAYIKVMMDGIFGHDNYQK